MKQTLLMAAMALSAGALLAQAEPGGQDWPLTPITAAVADSETDAQTDIEAFLKDKDKNGFGAPINAGVNKKDDGSVFVVSTGIGIVAAPITHPSFGASRARAFDRAMLDAKADMARTVAVALETSAQIRSRQYGESDPAADSNVALAEAMAKMPPDTLGGKMMLLLNRKLDNLLKEEGYDIDAARAEGNAAQAAAAAKKVIGEEEFSVARRAAANAIIGGLQAYYTVECVLPERVEIGVVAIWSPKMAELADAMVSGRQIVTEPGKPLAERIPSDKAKLLNTFGTQVVVDEHGEMVLVSYGQSAPRSSSGMSIRMARNNARLMAETQIRAFAEEEVAFNAATDEAEKTMDLEGMGQVYVDESTAEDFRKTYAKSMTLSGITQYTTWNAKHPQSGKIIYGSICVWSPSQALVGKALRDGWKSKEGATAQPTPTNARPNRGTGMSAPQFNRGAHGDANAI